jgi:hypothetical protein
VISGERRGDSERPRVGGDFFFFAGSEICAMKWRTALERSMALAVCTNISRASSGRATPRSSGSSPSIS